MSRKISKDQFARILEHADPSLVSIAENAITPADGSEFLHGLAAGLLLAAEMYQKLGGADKVFGSCIVSGVVAAIDAGGKNTLIE